MHTQTHVLYTHAGTLQFREVCALCRVGTVAHAQLQEYVMIRGEDSNLILIIKNVSEKSTFNLK